MANPAFNLEPSLGAGQGDAVFGKLPNQGGRMIKVTLLGTGGSRPDPNRNGPAALIQVDDDYLLFDADRGVVMQMMRAGVPIGRLNTVFITHHHFDHIGDLYDVILSTWFEGRRDPIRVYARLTRPGS